VVVRIGQAGVDAPARVCDALAMAGAAGRVLLLGSLVLAVAGCSVLPGGTSSIPLEVLTGAAGVRVTTPDPDPVADTPEAFCAAVATVPLRWTTDALVPMQIWVDAFEDATDAPAVAAPATAAILDFTRSRLRWSLTGEGERPLWDPALDEAAMTLIDTAITSCPDLPLAIGLPGVSERPRGWDDLGADELRAHCDDIAARVEAGIEEFTARMGRPPRHQMEMDLPSTAFVSSDWHGIVIGEDGEATVVPVAGGACDPGSPSG
jgi:hypothetical protein